MAWPSLSARILSVLLILGYPITAFFTLPPTGAATLLGLCIYCIILSPLMALIELPMLCACSVYCQCIARYLKYVSGWWWARAIIYIGFAAGGFAIYKVTTGSGWTWLILLLVFQVIAAALYLVATFMGEKHPAAELFGPKETPGAAAIAASTGSGKSSGGGAGLFGLFGARNKEEAIGKAVIAGASAAAANPNTAAALFGAANTAGRDLEASSPFAAQQPAKESSTANMFTGGSLFGGSSSGGSGANKSAKYGYGDDIPEANPFVS